jgi:hypothetical protein
MRTVSERLRNDRGRKEEVTIEMELAGKKVALLVAKDYEDPEFLYPYYRMREAGAEVVVVGTAESDNVVASKHGYPAEIDLRADEALIRAEEFDGLIVPGGWAPDRLRRCEKTLALVRAVFEGKKTVAAIWPRPPGLDLRRRRPGKADDFSPGDQRRHEKRGSRLGRRGGRLQRGGDIVEIAPGSSRLLERDHQGY